MRPASELPAWGMREAKVLDTRRSLPFRPARESVFGWPGLFIAIKSILLSFSAIQSIVSSLRKRRKASSKTAVHPPLNFGDRVMEALFLSPARQNMGTVKSIPMCEDSSCGSDLMVQDFSHQSESGTAVKAERPSASLFVLPDELISMCYDGLTAQDLTNLELVNRRLRDMVSSDGPCWRTCVKKSYANTCNASVMDAAATLAGGWKKFYAEKVCNTKENAPWVVPSHNEKLAIFDLIKGSAPRTTSTPTPTPTSSGSSADQMANSPASIMHEFSQAILSVILLIDGSSSVTEDDFLAMKDFSRALITSLRKTHSNASVALVQFNQYPRVESGLCRVSNLTVTQSIDAMEQMMGSTDIAAPIRRARQILTDQATEGEKAIILLSDGQTHADELEESEKEAKIAATENGARLFALGVGRDVDEAGLRRVASGTRATLPVNENSPDMNGAYFTLRRLKK